MGLGNRRQLITCRFIYHAHACALYLLLYLPMLILACLTGVTGLVVNIYINGLRQVKMYMLQICPDVALSNQLSVNTADTATEFSLRDLAEAHTNQRKCGRRLLN